jgi:hypothetical protein
MPFTAYVKVNAIAVSTSPGDLGWTQIGFEVDTTDPRNADWWWPDNPLMRMSMVAQSDVVAPFEFGKTYALTFAEDQP